jgi:hypothetical protein
MTDIVERLRALVRLQAIGEGAAIAHKKGLTEAADEIERLPPRLTFEHLRR